MNGKEICIHCRSLSEDFFYLWWMHGRVQICTWIFVGDVNVWSILDNLTARLSSSPREKQLIDVGKNEMGSKGDSMAPVVYQSLSSCQLPVAGQSWHGNISRAATSTHASVKKEQLFTMRQVEIICRNVLKEQEENVRGEFDNILSNKLAG